MDFLNSYLRYLGSSSSQSCFKYYHDKIPEAHLAPQDSSSLQTTLGDYRYSDELEPIHYLNSGIMVLNLAD